MVDAGAWQPLFFLSYAHPRESAQPTAKNLEQPPEVAKFFGDLSAVVAELVFRPTGSDPGFIDRTMEDGYRWTDVLLAALGTCQVLVVLLSPAYTQSEWCGLEWDAFTRREVSPTGPAASPAQRCVIPVTWSPVPDRRLPRCVQTVQRFLPDGEPFAEYRRRGIHGLLWVDDHDAHTAYRQVVLRLAERIRDLSENHEVKPGIFEKDELRDVFRDN